MTDATARTAGRQRGFALLLVLWTMVLLALLGTRIAANARSESQLAANIRDAAVTQAAAEGAVQEAGFHLLAAPGAPGGWRADGEPQRIRIGGVTAELRVTSEEGKINPNLASTELLSALLRQAGADAATAQSVAAAITAWRFPAAQADPATIRAYRAAGRDYVPSGRPFRDVDEVGAVVGMTPALLAQLAPSLSIYVTGDPDPAQASPIVRQAIEMATGRPPVLAPAPPPSLVAVTVLAAGPNGTRYARRAVLRLLRTGDGAPGIRILAWN